MMKPKDEIWEASLWHQGKRRITALLLSLSLIMNLLPTPVFAEETGNPPKPEETPAEIVNETEDEEKPIETSPAPTEAPVASADPEPSLSPSLTPSEEPSENQCLCDPQIEGEGEHTNPDCPFYVQPQISALEAIIQLFKALPSLEEIKTYDEAQIEALFTQFEEAQSAFEALPDDQFQQFTEEHSDLLVKLMSISEALLGDRPTTLEAPTVNEFSGSSFEELNSFISKAPSGSTVKLIVDLNNTGANSIDIKNKQTIILDLNGHAINSSWNLATIKVWSDSTLTLIDSSTEQTGTVNNTGYKGTMENNGIMNIQGGMIRSELTNGAGIGIKNNSGGTLTISGGKITTDKPKYHSISNEGTLTVTGGIIEALNVDVGSGWPTNYAIQNYNEGKVFINGGSIVTKRAIGVYNSSGTSGTVEINNGTITTEFSNTIYNEGAGSIKISGGELAITTGQAIINNSSGIINVTGGKINSAQAEGIKNSSAGTIIISGGTIQSTSGNTIENYNSGTINISGTADISSTSGTTIYNWQTGTIRIQGGTVQSTTTGSAIKNASTGTIEVSAGTVQSTTGSAIYNSSTGTIEVSAGTVQSTTGSAIYNASTGTIQVSGDAKVTSNIAATENKGTITLTKLPDPAANILAIKDNAQVTNTADPEGYSVYFRTTVLNLNDLDSYYSASPTAKVGRVYPEEVARIERNGTVFGRYMSLSDAISATQNGDLVKLMSPVTINKGETINNLSITLDLNGKTMTSIATSDYFTLKGTASLTIQDTSTAQMGKISSSSPINNQGTGTVRILSGTLESTQNVIDNIGTGEVIMTGGIVKSTGTSFNNTAIKSSQGKVTIQGGTVEGAGNYVLDTIASVEVSGGTIKATNTNGTAIYNKSTNNTGSVLISGEDTTIESINYAVNIEGDSSVSIENGTLKAQKIAILAVSTGSITISGGYLQAGKRVIENMKSEIVLITGGKLEAIRPEGSSENANVIFDAMKAGTISISNCTMKSTDDVIQTLYGKTLDISQSQLTSINQSVISSTITALETQVHGGKLQGKTGAITTAGTLVIDGDAQLSSEANTIEISSGGKLTMSGGTIQSSAEQGAAILSNTTQSMVINDAKIQATGAKGIAIQQDSSGKITVGGTSVISSQYADETSGTIRFNEASSTVVLTLSDTAEVKNTTGNYAVYFAKATPMNVKRNYSVVGSAKVGRVYPETGVEIYRGGTLADAKTTLAEAYAAAQSGDLLKLVQDFKQDTSELNVTDGMVLTLDLNGHEVNYTGSSTPLTVFYNGDLTLQDSSLGAKGTYSLSMGSVLNVAEGGKATLESGNLSSQNEVVYNQGEITISGAKIFSETSSIFNADQGKLTILQGTLITSSHKQSKSIDNQGTAEILGGLVEATGSSSSGISNRGTLTIGGNGVVQVTGSSAVAIDNIVEKSVVTLSENALVSSANSVSTKGTIWFRNSDDQNKPSLIIQDQAQVINTAADGYAVYYRDSSITPRNVMDYYQIADTTQVGKIYPEPQPVILELYDSNNMKKADHYTLTEAIEAAADNDILKVIRDFSVEESGVTIEAKNLTLDLNGKTISKKSAGYAITLTEDATLTVDDRTSEKLGKLETYQGIENQGKGEIILSGGLIEAINETVPTKSIAILGNAGKVHLDGGKISARQYGIITTTGDITISQGEMHTTEQANGGMIKSNTGTVTVTGGKLLSHNVDPLIRTDGSILISGGTLEKKGYTAAIIMQRSADATTRIEISGETTVIRGNYDLIVSGGKAPVTISGGTLESDRTAISCDVSGAPVNITGGTITAKENVIIGSKIKISGGMLISEEAEVFTNNISAEITGGTLISNAADKATLINSVKGTLKISDEAQISNTNGTAAIDNQGNLEITGGTIFAESESGIAILDQSGKNLTIQNAEIKATGNQGIALSVNTEEAVTIQDSTLSSSTTTKGTIYSTATGKLNFNGMTHVSNTAENGYALYFDNAAITGSNVRAQYTIERSAKVGKIYPVSTQPVVNVRRAGQVIDSYVKLEEAVQNAKSGDTLEMLEDVYLEATQVIQAKDLTLDLNGKVIYKETVGYAITLQDGASLTMDDSSTEQTGLISAQQVIENQGLGTITLVGGTIEAKMYLFESSITAISGKAGKVHLNGGSIITEVRAIETTTGEIVINKGKVENVDNATQLIVSETGTLTITNGTFISQVPFPLIETSGSIYISGGTFTHTHSAGFPTISSLATQGNVKIEIGGELTKMNNSDGPVLVTLGSASVIIAGGTLESTSDLFGVVLNGNTAGNLIVTGGTILSHGIQAAILNDSETGKVMIQGGKITAKKAVLESKGNVEISGGILESEEDVVLKNTKTAMISGGTLKSTAVNKPTLVNTDKGMLQISKNAKILNTQGTAAVDNQGSLEITGGTMTAEAEAGIAVLDQSGKSLTIQDAVIEAKGSQGAALSVNTEKDVMIQDSTLTSPTTTKGTIYSTSTGKLILNGTTTVNNTTENGYALYFQDSANIDSDHVRDFYQIGEKAEVGLIYPEPGLLIVSLERNGTVVKQYTQMQEAIQAAQSGDTLKVLEDFQLAKSGVEIQSKNLTLDLNGKTIRKESTGYAITLKDAASLTVNDASEAQTGLITANQGIENQGKGTITLTGGTIEAKMYGTGGAVIAISGQAGKIHINGGSIITELEGIKTTTGNIEISKGRIVNTEGYGGALIGSETGTVSIKDGTFFANIADPLIRTAGSIFISGGLFEKTDSRGNPIIKSLATDANVTIEIGGESTRMYIKDSAVIMNMGKASVRITGGMLESKSDYTGVILNNTTAGDITISGGTIQSRGSQAAIVNNSETGKVIIQGGKITAKKAVVESKGNVEISGGTLESEEDVVLKNTKTAMISGGILKSLAANQATLVNTEQGTLKISGDAQILNPHGTASVDNQGSLEITGGTLVAEGETGIALYDHAGKELNIANATIQALGNQGRAIYTNTTKPITISKSFIQAEKEQAVVIYSASTGKFNILADTEVIHQLEKGTALQFAYSAITGYNVRSYYTIDEKAKVGIIVPEPAPLVISLKHQGQETGQYTTLQEAIDHAVSGDTLTVIEDFTTLKQSTVLANKQLTLDLHGKTITKTEDDFVLTLSEDASLIVDDRSAAKLGKLAAVRGIQNTSTGQITLSGGTIETEDLRGKSIAIDGGAGKVHLSGGTIVTKAVGIKTTTGEIEVSQGTLKTSDNVLATGELLRSDTGTIKISGGILESSADTYPMIKNSGSILISGGSIGNNQEKAVEVISNTSQNENDQIVIQGKDTVIKTTSNRSLIYNQGKASVTIAGGTLEALNGILINIRSYGGSILISDGQLRSKKSVISNNSKAGIQITGGTLESLEDFAIANYMKAPIKIAGAGLSAKKEVIWTQGTLEITDGMLTSKGDVVLRNQNTMTITGGTVYSLAEGKSAIVNPEGKTLTIGKDATIVNTEEGHAIENAGELVITGGQIYADAAVIENAETAKLTMSGGKLSSSVSEVLINQGTADISGGTLKSVDQTKPAIVNLEMGSVLISKDAEITKQSGAAAMDNQGKVSMSGGHIVTGSGTAIENQSSGTVTIAGGKVEATESKGVALRSHGSGKIMIENNAVVTSKNSNSAVNPEGTIVVDQQSLTSPEVVFTVKDTAAVINTANGYAAAFVDKAMTSYDVAQYYAIAESAQMGKIYPQPKVAYVLILDASGTMKNRYETLAEAIEAAESGETVSLVKAIDLKQEGITFDKKAITLDINGLTISGNGTVALLTVGKEASLTIQDSKTQGKIQSIQAGIALENYGKLIILNGTMIAEQKEVIHNHGLATLTIGGEAKVLHDGKKTIVFSEISALTQTLLTVKDQAVIANANPEEKSYALYFEGVKPADLKTLLQIDDSASVGRIYPAVTVEKVTVNPAKVSVRRGKTQVFKAQVSGEFEPAQTVNWKLEGNLSEGTTLDAQGLLTIGPEETSTTLTINATSAVDQTKTASSSVTVLPAYELRVVNGEGSDFYLEGEKVTISAPKVKTKEFIEWSSNQSVTLANPQAAVTTFMMPAQAVTITAVYEAIDTTDLEQAIQQAKTTKEPISVSDSPASSVAKGRKFVSAAEMNTLNESLQKAIDRLEDPESKAEVLKAKEALEQAVKDFIAAIKIGTYEVVEDPLPEVIPSPTAKPVPSRKPTAPTASKDVIVTEKQVEEALKQAVSKVSEEDQKVTLHLGDSSVKTASFSFNLPKATQELILDRQIHTTVLVLDQVGMQLSLDLAAIEEIYKQAQNDVQITAVSVDSSKLSNRIQQVVQDFPVYALSASYADGQILDLKEGTLQVAIPVRLSKSDQAAHLIALSLREDQATSVLFSAYDQDAQAMVMAVDHFGQYSLTFVESDSLTAAGHWAQSALYFAYNRGLLGLIEEAEIKPDQAITRIQLAAALGQLAHFQPDSSVESSYEDVEDPTLAGYAAWAVKQGLITCEEENRFDPQEMISRTELASILVQFAKLTKTPLEDIYEIKDFTDQDQLSEASIQAVRVLQQAGILSAKDQGQFDPNSPITQAEFAMILQRWIEKVLGLLSPDGWFVNDAGQSMYYIDGIAVVDQTLSIQGRSYTFDAYGVCQNKALEEAEKPRKRAQRNEAKWTQIQTALKAFIKK
ncbi:S-layer homology domain-containing protein [Holdemania massiliensis]|uniref:S-layer homology domain-containing protein n=1 Tax=Holdemania massiliensis TaxID=1468449 RepID=UPI001F052174|nr:S-layer homology domain-containing protein [Holdemania massiliensis]MCH1942221.1 S-layer homology domain-containing protein [Holdemania massiliensis]